MHRTMEHGADVGIEASGATWEEAFSEGAIAMLGVMADAATVKAEKEVKIEATATDTAALFVEFLNEILYIRDAEGLLLSKFKITIKDNSLAGSAWGEKLDQKRHRTTIEVKAATYSGLKAWEENGRKHVQCVLDV
jgi:SHS2 domain-containing protein